MKSKLLFPIFLLAVSVIACNQPVTNEEQNKPEEQKPAIKTEIKTFQNPDSIAEMKGTFGYDVFVDGNLYIHQPNIPSVSGNKGFKNEELAKKAGAFVTYKIQNNIMPPSVTPEELDSLGVR